MSSRLTPTTCQAVDAALRVFINLVLAKRKPRQAALAALVLVMSTIVSQLRKDVPIFLNAVIERLATMTHAIDVSSYVADHVCLRTETEAEYLSVCQALTNAGCALLVESVIGGRFISTFAFEPPIHCPSSGHSIAALEVPAPKRSSFYKSGLEHVEFALSDVSKHSPANTPDHKSALLAFVSNSSTISTNLFDCTASDKYINPDVSLELTNLHYKTNDAASIKHFPTSATVKFHLIPLTDVIAWEIANQKDAGTRLERENR